MCDGAVDDSLAALRLISNWFLISKTIKKLYIALYADDGLLFFDENSDFATFCCNEMGFPALTILILIIILMEIILILLFLSDFWVGRVNLKTQRT